MSEYDFEGRCAVCAKRLKLRVKRTDSPHKIELIVVPCEKHPDDSLILWPSHRDDLVDE
jgi:hypothetical protein